MPGWGEFFGGIGYLLGKLPIQGRKERWKNELDNLEKKRQKLLSGKCSAEASAELVKILARISVLQDKLKNIDEK